MLYQCLFGVVLCIWNFINDIHLHTHTHLLIFKGKYALSSLKWSHEYVLPCNGMLCRVMRCGWDALKTGWYFIAWSYFLHCTILYQTYNVYLGKINVYMFSPMYQTTHLNHIHTLTLIFCCDCISMRCCLIPKWLPQSAISLKKIRYNDIKSCRITVAN